MLHSLLYISESRLSIPAEEWQIDAIVDVSRSRNFILEVTGALMFTHSNFVQVLEGRQTAIEELMASIKLDPRHCKVRVLEVEPIASRRFATWSMAYVGPAALVESSLKPLLTTGAEGLDPFATQDMITLLRSLASLGQ